jgi:hypothetical protein
MGYIILLVVTCIVGLFIGIFGKIAWDDNDGCAGAVTLLLLGVVLIIWTLVGLIAIIAG